MSKWIHSSEVKLLNRNRPLAYNEEEEEEEEEEEDHEDVCRSEGIAPRILNLGIRWSASRPSSFIPGKEATLSTGQEAGWASE
jgi:hypothetical protein